MNTKEIAIDNIKEMKIQTSQGTLKAKLQEDEDFPGVLISLGDELYARVEFYEDTKELRLIAYNDVDEQPAIAETLKSFN